MAFSAGVVWEYRATGGDSGNGGAYNSAASGTDRSNQDAAHATYTDIVIDGSDNTKITSAATAFASDDVGNIINITSGTGFTVQRVEIISEAAGVATCDKAVGTTGSTGGNGKLGGALDVLTDALGELALPGHKLWIANDGTQTLTGNFAMTVNGSGGSEITMEGYNSTRGDAPILDDRPLIAAGANTFELGTSWIAKHLRATTTSATGWDDDGGCVYENCKCENTSGSGGREAFNATVSTAGTRWLGCDGKSANGVAFFPSQHCNISYCYLHDSDKGVDSIRDDVDVANSIIDTCTTGLELLSTSCDFWSIFNNTFYGAGTGTAIDIVSGGIRHTIIGNIFDDWTDGVKSGGVASQTISDYNVYNCTTDRTNVAKGAHDVDGDPLLTDPANGDFTLASGSPAINAGANMPLASGVAVALKFNAGADQTDPDAGGGGGGGGVKLVGPGGGLIG